MENGGTKNIVLIALVVVLSFIIGSYTVDGMKDAVIPIIVMAGMFVMLYLGKNCKYLIFYLPPIAKLTRMGLPFEVLVPIGVMVYWAVMRFMGYVRFRWTRHLGMDIPVLLIFLYMCLCFYRHPVAINALGIDLDTVGGVDYVYCVFGMLAYVAVSSIPFTGAELYKIIRNYVILNLGVQFALTGISVVTGADMSDGEGGDMVNAAQNTRFSVFAGIGTSLFALVYAFIPLRKMLVSPVKILVLMLCVAAVVFSGWRGTLIAFAFTVLILAWFKKELSFVVSLGALAYAGLLFLSSERALNSLPFGIQRSLCAIPGVHVSKAVEADAEGSSDWRVEMWKWALDPRTSLIKDYVWGDGPGLSKAFIGRRQTAIMRGARLNGDNRDFAAMGVWHSGWITLLHRYGIVGLLLIGLGQLVYCLFSVLTCLRYRPTPHFPYVMVMISPIIPGFILYHLGTGMPLEFFDSLFMLAVYKIIYVRAAELGLPSPLFNHASYVPLMIQDIQGNEDKSTYAAG